MVLETKMGINEFQRLGGGGGGEVSSILCSPVLDIGYMIYCCLHHSALYKSQPSFLYKSIAPRKQTFYEFLEYGSTD